jgi:hypothetical protein
MKIGVCVDGDGHFNAAKITDRPGIIQVLKAIMDGDYFEDAKEDLDDNLFDKADDYMLFTDEEWLEFVHNFVQRNTFELVEI